MLKKQYSQNPQQSTSKTKETPEAKAERIETEKVAKEKSKKLESHNKKAVTDMQNRSKKIKVPKEVAEARKANEANDYKPPVGTLKLWHIEIDTPIHDVKTGKKLSNSHIVKMTDDEKKQLEANKGTLGYTAKVVHNPLPYRV